MMKKGIAKFTAFCLSAGLTFSGTGIVSMATGADMSLVGIGSTTKVNKTVTQTPASEASEETAVEETGAVDTGAVEASAQEAPAQETIADNNIEAEPQGAEETPVVEETEAPLDTSMVNTTGFAKCNEYVNIRATGDTQGEVLGKLYNNAAVYILGVDEHGWYKVRSGNVEGYVASQYIATGAVAEQISDEVGYNVAEVGAEVLNVRASASTDSEVVAVVAESEQIEVVEDCGEWLKVAVDADTYGYVSVDYVNAETQYKVAESIEEEQARLAEEQAAADAAWLAYLAEQEAAQAQAEAEWLAYVEQQNAAQQTAQTTTTTTDASSAQAEADALYQEYLDAQAEADAATQQADEQLVYDTAAQAQQAYQEFLAAQNAADQAAVQQTTTTTTDNSYVEDAYTEDTYTEDDTYYEEEVYEEDYVEDDEEVYVEDTYEDEYVEDASSAVTSSIGQEIANYACQFVGNPYVWGGTSLTNGADCSGFTQSVMANFGIGISRTAASQSGGGTAIDLGSIQPGDLLFYSDGGSIGHVSIYIGNGQVVHASNPTNGIIISSYGYRTPVSARRYW